VLVFGPDLRLVRERADAIIQASVDDPRDPFALVRLEGDELAADPMRLVDEAQTVRSELKDNAQLVHEELEKLTRDVAAQTDAIRRTQEELSRVRHGPVARTLFRWLGRSDV